MDMTKSDKIRKQIEFAFNDEGKHYKMFQQIYYTLTGQYIDIPMQEPQKNEKFIELIESSINGELEAVELYRKIRSMLPNTQLRDMLFEIITDEQEHATRFVYLYSMEK
jgi:rubrerythrin